MSTCIRRALRPVQKATSASALISPPGASIRAAGLALYSALRAAASPLMIAFFHCSRGAKGTLDAPAELEAIWPQETEMIFPTVNRMKMQMTVRGGRHFMNFSLCEIAQN